MNQDAIRTAYSKLPPIPNPPGERCWFNRLDTFDKFIKNGQFEADHFRMVGRKYGRTERDGYREEAPELFDLMMRAFPTDQGSLAG